MLNICSSSLVRYAIIGSPQTAQHTVLPNYAQTLNSVQDFVDCCSAVYSYVLNGGPFYTAYNSLSKY